MIGLRIPAIIKTTRPTTELESECSNLDPSTNIIGSLSSNIHYRDDDDDKEDISLSFMSIVTEESSIARNTIIDDEQSNNSSDEEDIDVKNSLSFLSAITPESSDRIINLAERQQINDNSCYDEFEDNEDIDYGDENDWLDDDEYEHVGLHYNSDTDKNEDNHDEKSFSFMRVHTNESSDRSLCFVSDDSRKSSKHSLVSNITPIRTVTPLTVPEDENPINIGHTDNISMEYVMKQTNTNSPKININKNCVDPLESMFDRERIPDHNEFTSNEQTDDTQRSDPTFTSCALESRLEETVIGPNMSLKIIGGKYKGMTCTFVKRTPKRVWIRLDETNQDACLKPEFITKLGSNKSRINYSSTSVPSSLEPLSSLTVFEADTPLTVIGGTYKGKTCTFLRRTAKRVWIRLDETGKEACINPENISKSGSRESYSNIPDHHDFGTYSRYPGSRQTFCTWRVPEAKDSRFNRRLGLRMEFCQLVPPSKIAQRERTFAFHIFRNRLFSYKIDINSALTALPKESVEIDGCKYELLSTKMHRKNSCFGKFLRTEFSADYVATSGPNLEAINLKTILESIAGFGRLSPEKVASRLELFQSTASKKSNGESMIFDDLLMEDFEIIRERSHEGCGFIPRSYIERFLGSKVIGKRTFALQVRIFSSKLGIFKGMLFEKLGIQKIQLPSSMKKVPASTISTEDKVCLLITSNGVFPSTNSRYMAKIFKGEKPPKRFSPKELSDMICTLFKEKGVPSTIINHYRKKTHGNRTSELTHCCLVGLADPTTTIPAGCVILTGMSVAKKFIGDEIFVTRFPCSESSDGRKLRVLNEKPALMSEYQYSWLDNLHFGGIIFGNPYEGDIPMPAKLANGDLDGDLYFVCWNRNILSRMRCDEDYSPGTFKKRQSDVIADIREWNFNWLSDGQDLMRDVPRMYMYDQLIRTLHKLWQKFYKGSAENLMDTAASATSVGRAYKQSIDLMKHGGQVVLPKDLWDRFPSHLHRFLKAD